MKCKAGGANESIMKKRKGLCAETNEEMELRGRNSSQNSLSSQRRCWGEKDRKKMGIFQIMIKLQASVLSICLIMATLSPALSGQLSTALL